MHGQKNIKLRSLSQWTEWPGCEVDHSLPSSIKLKNMWRFISSPLHALMTFTGNTFVQVTKEGGKVYFSCLVLHVPCL